MKSLFSSDRVWRPEIHDRRLVEKERKHAENRLSWQRKNLALELRGREVGRGGWKVH